jgi:hypothetical protein
MEEMTSQADQGRWTLHKPYNTATRYLQLALMVHKTGCPLHFRFTAIASQNEHKIQFPYGRFILRHPYLRITEMSLRISFCITPLRETVKLAASELACTQFYTMLIRVSNFSQTRINENGI